MSRLSEKLCPGLLTSDYLESLRKGNTRTVADIIGRDAIDLASKSSVLKKDLLLIQKSLVEQFSSFPIRGSDLFDELLSNFCILSTGCSNLDLLLDGGLCTGEVTELVGPAGAGKTQVCLSISAFLAKEKQRSVLYIDTGGSFSGKRLQEILCSRFNITEQDIPVILSRIHCIQAFDIFSVLGALEKLKETLKNETEDRTIFQDLHLVIVDSVASVISPILGGHQCHGHALMVKLSRSLKSLAMDYDLAVVVTNNVVSDNKSPLSSKPALGPTWSHIPNIRVFISKNDNSQNKIKQSTERIARLTKSSRQPLQSCTAFQIGPEGITDYPLKLGS